MVFGHTAGALSVVLARACSLIKPSWRGTIGTSGPLLGVLAYSLIFLLTGSASANKLTLTISDVDLRYDMASGLIYDNPNQASGNLDPTESDPVVSTVFEIDNQVEVVMPSGGDATEMFDDVLVSTLPASIYAGLPAPLSLPESSFGIDWFAGEYKLRLAVQQVVVTQTENVFVLSTQAVVTDQMLPENMKVEGPAEIAFVSTSPTLDPTQNGGLQVVASGALSITATLIPEPTAVLLLLSAAALASVRVFAH